MQTCLVSHDFISFFISFLCMKALEVSSSLYIWLTLTENSKNSKHFLQKHKLYIELSIGRRGGMY